MCRAYPGFRCSNHPSLIVRQIARRTWAKETTRELLQTELHTLTESIAAGDEIENASEKQVELETKISELNTEVSHLEERMKTEMTDYYMTHAGQEALTEAIANAEKNDAAKRMDLANEKVAAESRRAKQKKVGDFMQKPDVPMAAKIWRGNLEVTKAKRELQGYDERAQKLTIALAGLDKEILEAKRAGDDDEFIHLTQQKREYIQELSFVEKQGKHLRAHIAGTKSWIKKQREGMVGKMFDFTDSLVLQFIKYSF